MEAREEVEEGSEGVSQKGRKTTRIGVRLTKEEEEKLNKLMKYFSALNKTNNPVIFDEEGNPKYPITRSDVLRYMVYAFFEMVKNSIKERRKSYERGGQR